MLKKKQLLHALSDNQKEEQIIFPYYYDDNNTLMRYDEDTFKSRFPNAHEHLRAFKDRLDERDSEQIGKMV